MEYKNRIADQLLRDKLEAMGAVLIEGPKRLVVKRPRLNNRPKVLSIWMTLLSNSNIGKWLKPILVFCSESSSFD